MREFFKRLRPRHYSTAVLYTLSGVVWPSYVALFPVLALRTPLDVYVLAACLWVSVFGALVQIFGYLSTQQTGRLGVLGVSIELIGLILLSIAPIIYIVAFVLALFDSSLPPPAVAVSILMLVVAALYVDRAVTIVPRFFREAHDDTKE